MTKSAQVSAGSYTQQRRAREQEQRKNAILQAAWDLFLEAGISGTSMEDIARRCELARGTLYLYFRSKDEMAFELLLKATEDLLVTLSSALDPAQPAVRQIEKLALTYYRFYIAQPEAFRYMFVIPHDSYAGKVSEDVLERWGATGKAALQVIASLLSQAQAEGDLEVEDPWSTAITLWAAVTGVISIPSQKVRRPFLGEVDIEAMLEHLVKMIIAGQRPAEPKQRQGKAGAKPRGLSDREGERCKKAAE